MAVELGSFQLVSFLARGGTGEVWQARHRRFGTPVAVKVIRPAAARRGAMLLQEVGATAALDHPNIIRVLDVGEVLPETAARSAGWLEHGSTWMAMEMASGGSLAQIGRAPRSWSAVRGILVSLLDALAHAHARGFVHLDVKPSNVMFCSQSDARPGPKLTDFGIAQALHGPADVSGMIAGTPTVMAPEQWLGRWHEIGPWTDLYGLGCIAWWLITGHPVFRRDEVAALGIAHCRERPEGFVSRMVVPPDTETWVRWLLAKRPRDRVDRAAEARLALLALGEPKMLSSDPPSPLPPASIGLDHAESNVASLDETHAEIQGDGNDATTLVTLPDLSDTPPLPRSAPQPRVLAARLPDDWRAPEHPRPFERMIGMALLSLRTVPVVGREAERDALWTALGRTIATQRPQVVILRGLPGYGKTRLARWLGEQAHLSGVGAVYRSAGHAAPGALDPVSTLVYNALRGPTFARDGLLTELRAVMGPDADATGPLASLLHPLMPDGAPEALPAFTGDRHEAFSLIQAFLLRHRRDRAAVLLLDDVHLSPVLLDFGAALLQVPGVAPFLIVMTLNDAALVEDAALRDRLGTIARHERARLVPVGPLPPVQWAEMADAVLHLDPELRRRLCLHAAGSPQIIVQLSGDWLESGWIESSADGLFRATRGDPPMPRDLRSIWASRLARALATRSEDDRRALELAAAVGHEVHDGRWARACQLAGIEASADLASVLARAGLAWRPTPESTRWMFAHHFVRDLLVERARAAGRWEQHNAVCAESIDARWRDSASLACARGAWLLESGASEAAIEPLVWGAILSHRSGNLQNAESQLAWWERALTRAGVPRTDARWGTGLVLRVGLLAQRGSWGEAFTLLDEVEAIGRAHAWADPLVDALRFRSQLGDIRGQPREITLAIAEEAVALAERVGSRTRLGMAHVSLGLAHRADGCDERAIEAFQTAITCFEHANEQDLLARTQRTLGEVYLDVGQLPAARKTLVAAASALAERGLRGEEAMAHRALARLSLEQGDATACEQQLGHARRLLAHIGGHALITVIESVATLRLRQRRIEEARADLEEAIALATETDLLPNLLSLRAQQALLAACAPDAELWRTSLSALRTMVDREPHIDTSAAAAVLAEAVEQAGGIGLPTDLAVGLARDLAGRNGEIAAPATKAPRASRRKAS